MRVASFVLALSALSLASIAAASTCKARPTTCEMLEKRYPGTVSWPDDETYIAENEGERRYLQVHHYLHDGR